MTVASDRQYLNLQLIPMRISEAALEPINIDASPQVGGATIATALSGTEGHRIKQLVLYPGEPSEMLIKLENLGQKYIYFQEINIETNLPADWYTLQVENHQIAPGNKMEAALVGHIPKDFFESQISWQIDKSLKLDYFGRINISYALLDQPISNPPDSETLRNFESIDFNIYIRPRSLYLNFLPDLYREVDFIGRLLNIFEQTFEPSVQTLDVIHDYLDPRTAPETLLPFLAYWVGWQMIPNIESDRQRQLIHRAIEIYRWRGTKRGLQFYLHLYTDLPLDEEHIFIQDVFERGFVTGETRLGQDSIVGGGKPYHFIVRLRHKPYHQINEQLIRQIIEQEKPAFCTYELYMILDNSNDNTPSLPESSNT
ncbi:phage tail protein [Anabaena sp. UHCC 0204]|uniref:phage tail protein n=2 Tax=unclassified Anabaena TaxID=2619674 RepID=UPI0014487CF6|nr:phage tail protein [Anabaena sp. UHCC 0204]MTJ08127.1 phage tail protein [Anabaena sp. UHCC 0204]